MLKQIQMQPQMQNRVGDITTLAAGGTKDNPNADYRAVADMGGSNSTPLRPVIKGGKPKTEIIEGIPMPVFYDFDEREVTKENGTPTVDGQYAKTGNKEIDALRGFSNPKAVGQMNMEIINLVAEQAIKIPNSEVRYYAEASSTGSDEYNKELSIDRANNAKKAVWKAIQKHPDNNITEEEFNKRFKIVEAKGEEASQLAGNNIENPNARNAGMVFYPDPRAIDYKPETKLTFVLDVAKEQNKSLTKEQLEAVQDQINALAAKEGVDPKQIDPKRVQKSTTYSFSNSLDPREADLRNPNGKVNNAYDPNFETIPTDIVLDLNASVKPFKLLYTGVQYRNSNGVPLTADGTAIAADGIPTFNNHQKSNTNFVINPKPGETVFVSETLVNGAFKQYNIHVNDKVVGTIVPTTIEDVAVADAALKQGGDLRNAADYIQKEYQRVLGQSDGSEKNKPIDARIDIGGQFHVRQPDGTVQQIQVVAENRDDYLTASKSNSVTIKQVEQAAETSPALNQSIKALGINLTSVTRAVDHNDISSSTQTPEQLQRDAIDALKKIGKISSEEANHSGSKSATTAGEKPKGQSAGQGAQH